MSISTLPTPFDWGAAGDGSRDDALALTAWLSAIAGAQGYLPRGVYPYSTDLLWPACRVDGAGGTRSVLRSLDPEVSIRNANARVAGQERLDIDTLIQGVGFEGDSLAEPDYIDNFIVLIGTDGWTFRDCRFSHRRSDLVVLRNCQRTAFERCVFRDWGSRIPPEVPGTGQYVGGCAVFAWIENDALSIIDCDFEGGGGGIWCGATRTILRGNRGRDMVEAAIIGLAGYSICEGNIMGRIETVDVSGSQVEAGGEGVVYANNIFYDASHSNLYLFNPSKTVIGHNLIVNPNQDSAANTSGITIASWLPAVVGAPTPDCVLVDGNVVCDDDRAATHAIHVADMGGGVVDNVKVTNNEVGDDSQWQDKPVEVLRKGVVAVHNN